MRDYVYTFVAIGLVGCLPLNRTFAGDTNDKSDAKTHASKPVADGSRHGEADVPEVNLLEAARSGEISVKAEGREDGRMTVSVTNRTRHQLRVVLPPGLIAQGATGQFGGMGGMGGGMGGMGGGMGGMGGGMGGMGGGMGGMGGGMGGGMMGGMGRMGRGTQTMPAIMGMMMLARIIMYFCGDPDSWDMRSLMIGMMGMRGMGGMGGGMGGMGGMGGGMGGGMRSVPATRPPSAVLKPGQTRHLPTRLVSLMPPDPESGAETARRRGSHSSSPISLKPTAIHGCRRPCGAWPRTWLHPAYLNWSCGTYQQVSIGTASPSYPENGPTLTS